MWHCIISIYTFLSKESMGQEFVWEQNEFII